MFIIEIIENSLLHPDFKSQVSDVCKCIHFAEAHILNIRNRNLIYLGTSFDKYFSICSYASDETFISPMNG